MSESRYEEIANWYANRVQRGTWAHKTLQPYLDEMTGDLQGVRLLDLACGEGKHAVQFNAMGAVVTGVDLSPSLLEIARNRSGGSHVHWVLDDARSLESFPDSVFDACTCIMALMDIPDLPAVLRAVRRVVISGGWFLIAITHPAFESPNASWDSDGARTQKRYLSEGEWYSTDTEGIRYRVGAIHRTLATYINEPASVGWILERAEEPENIQPDIPNADIPGYLLLRFRAFSKPTPS